MEEPELNVMAEGKKYRTKFASLVGFCNNNNFGIIGLYGFECPYGRRAQRQEGFRYPLLIPACA